MARLRPLVPILLLCGAILGLRLTGLDHFASFAELGRRQADLQGFVAAHPLAAPLAYVAAYAAAVAASVPIGVLLSVAGGVLFGAVFGTALAVLGASAGAVAVFLLARRFAGLLRGPNASRLLDRVRPALQRDGFSALLALRLLPVVPFWIMNLAPAFAGTQLIPYAAATALGIIPATAVFVSLGAGLGDTLAAGLSPDVSCVFAPRVLWPLLALAALALTPIIWRRWRARHA